MTPTTEDKLLGHFTYLKALAQEGCELVEIYEQSASAGRADVAAESFKLMRGLVVDLAALQNLITKEVTDLK